MPDRFGSLNGAGLLSSIPGPQEHDWKIRKSVTLPDCIKMNNRASQAQIVHYLRQVRNRKITTHQAAREIGVPPAWIPTLLRRLRWRCDADILCEVQYRTVNSNRTVTWQGTRYQLLSGKSVLQPGSRVQLLIRLDGTMNVRCGGKPIMFRPCIQPADILANRSRS